MFLLPAFGASTCDVAILYLYIHFSSLLFPSSSSSEDTGSPLPYGYYLTHVFICLAAVIRLFLVLGPLQRRLATGTRITHLGPYVLFHTTYFLFLCTVFPKVSPPSSSTSTLSPWYSYDPWINETQSSQSLFIQGESGEDKETKYSQVQSWIFYSSLLSIGLHGILLLHVKSSAPIRRKITLDNEYNKDLMGFNEHASSSIMGSAEEEGGAAATTPMSSSTTSKRKMMAYWIYDQYRKKRRDSYLHSSSSLENQTGSQPLGGGTPIQQGRRRTIRTSAAEESMSIGNTKFMDTGDESNESGIEMDFQREMMRMEDDYDLFQEEEEGEKDDDVDDNHDGDRQKSEYLKTVLHSNPDLGSHMYSAWNGESTTTTTTASTDPTTGHSLNDSTQQDLEYGDDSSTRYSSKETQPFLNKKESFSFKQQTRRSKRDKDHRKSIGKSQMSPPLSSSSTSTPFTQQRHPSAFWKSLSDRQRKIRFIGLPTCLSTKHYDDVFQEIRHQFQRTKRNWVDRLEDFTYRIQIQHFPTTTVNGNHPSNHSLLVLNHLTPFRALLQLYAYEEVFSNHKLDRAFAGGGEDATGGGGGGSGSDLTLTFYAPQLLCFLLHNAYLNTGKLERWILRKCRSNIYFAHKCYWFIRSWCLHSCTLCLDNQNGMGSNNASTSSPIQDMPKVGLDSRETSTTSLSSLLDGWGKKSPAVLDENEESIVSAEERQLMISLLGKIMKCGETAAGKFELDTSRQSAPYDLHELRGDEHPEISTQLQSQTGNHANETSSIQTEWIPINPTTGSPSISHLMAVQYPLSTYRFPPTSSPSVVGKSSQSLFLQTPRFLDALIAVADDLRALPRSERNAELQKRLRSLEVDFLPSNSIYVPVNNCMHRVWRIVVSESLAISTKERVPCIVCLEVIDQDKSPSTHNLWMEDNSENMHADGRSFRFGSPLSNNRTDYDILRSWYTTQRYPQRHNSLLDKVTTYTQQSLKKLRDEIEDTITQHDQRLFDVNIFTDRQTNSINPPSSDIESAISAHETMANIDFQDSSNSERVVTIEGTVPMDSKMYIKPPLPTTLSSLQGRGVANQIRGHMKTGDVSTMSPSNTPNSSLPSSRSSSCPSSPVINLGQWTSPPHGGMGKRFLAGDKAPKLVVGDIESINIRSETKQRDSYDDGLDPNSYQIRKPSIILNTSTNQEYGSTDYMPLSVLPLSKTDRSPKTMKKQPLADISAPNKERSSSKSTKFPPAIVFKEDWSTKQKRLRLKSAFGTHPQWRLLPILIKSNDDLRQEQLASQLIHCMASILARAKVSVWLYPYEIIALTYRGGIIEAIPDTISIDSLKKNDPTYTDLKSFFEKHFGPPTSDEYEGAKANFVESLAAYSIVCFLLQIKDRHNGNILLDNKGHLIHIDFGFFFLSSPGKNSGFESAPFKLTREFVDLMDGPHSRTFSKFRELCCRTFLELRKNCYQITLLVEMLMEGNDDLNCFRGKPEVAVQELQERFCLDLNDRACVEFVNSLVDDSLENWRTTWYDRYQRCFVGVM